MRQSHICTLCFEQIYIECQTTIQVLLSLVSITLFMSFEMWLILQLAVTMLNKFQCGIWSIVAFCWSYIKLTVGYTICIHSWNNFTRMSQFPARMDSFVFNVLTIKPRANTYLIFVSLNIHVPYYVFCVKYVLNICNVYCLTSSDGANISTNLTQSSTPTALCL